MSSAVVSRQAAGTASTSGRPALALPRPSCRAPPQRSAGFGPAIPAPSRFDIIRAQAKKDERKAEPGAQPSPANADGADDAPSPFIEPLIRGLVLGIGAGVLTEMLHVAFKVGETATDGGWHMPTGAQIYEQLAPLFVWDHAVAISFWMVFYIIEAAAILAILREYPDDKQASKVIRSTVTLPKRLMPLKLSAVKRAVHGLISGRGSPQASTQGATPMAFRDGGSAPPRTPAGLGPSASGLTRSGSGGAGTAVLERPRPTAEPEPQQPARLQEPEAAAKNVPEAPEKPKPGARPPRGGSLSAQLRAAAGLKPGQLAPGSPLLQGGGSGGGSGVTVNPRDALAAKREKELADRRAYLQNFWYAAALSEKLKAGGKPIKVDILSRTVTLWRGEDGQVHCLDNVCPHRGAPLSGGWTKTKKDSVHASSSGSCSSSGSKAKGGKAKGEGTSCVVCPYHGWAFNGDGQLEEVPSQAPEVAFPRRPLVNAYPVEERGGFVWLFFGAQGLPADERPPIPLVPELEDSKNWRAVYGEMEFDCPHWSVFENALDMAHIHYLHDGSFGNQDKPIINDMKVTRDTWSVAANFSIHNKPVNPLWNFAAVPAVPVEARALLPSTSYVKITLGAGIQMITYVNTVPIDEKRSINRFCLIRNFALSPLFDDYTRKSMFKILGEDKAMIELLKPEQLLSEVSLEADKPQIAFRKLRQEWVDMGYGVQPDPIASHKGSLRVDM
ncbi:hypothetical protein HYH02_015139 [Chlamydomonas schloesseri]|uniref:Rieske domain-containing protein n=1 Tax=Chlamydomonas schloesseri TaxID=2026947 RepID=A0A835SH54_9CHLO|nr:hypothetical protein HYH02_015139 [Chlamydomonas schloesseri]|eukprot:KAG2424757.1 hypothetical protein HYH02_015139 [Chlamydomonas schloesseri]